MSDYIEIELASGLNKVLYLNPYADIEVKPSTQLFIKNYNDNDYTPIGTLAEVRVASGFGTFDIKTKDKKYIDTIDMMSGKINIKLFAKPPSSGGRKRKTRKYKRINKRKTRKYKKR
jgi:hypothetical protein